jgi:hypothetical protein
MKKHLLATLVVVLGATAPALTQAQALSIERLIPYRTRLTIVTCDQESAGTDDRIYVRFTGNSSQRFYLDKGGNDLERNTSNTFEIVPAGVRRVSDITRLTLEKTGSDALCITRIQLRFNNDNNAVLDHSFGSGTWIDGDEGYTPRVTITGTTLRSGLRWNLNGATERAMCQLPGSFPRAMLEPLIEGAVGHAINSPESPSEVRDLYWGGLGGRGYVQVERVDGNTSSADLDLVYSLDGYANPNVDVDFRMDASCSAGSFNLAINHVDVTADFPDYLDWLTLGLQPIATTFINAILDAFTANLSQSLSLPTMFCPGVSTDSYGGIALNWGVLQNTAIYTTALCQ